MIALWDTTGSEVVQALAAERRNAGGVASGLALTLVVVVDEKRVKEAEAAAAAAAAAHPCRLLIVVRGFSPPPDSTGPSDSRLDAEIVVGGRLGPCEAVVMRMSGRLTHHAESVVIPLLAPDVPVVTWWHGAPPAEIATDPLGVLADRRITDVAQAPEVMEALVARAKDYAPGDTDLAWTRSTPWRSLIAGALDTTTSPVVSVSVTADPADPTTALLRGWLCSRLGLAPTTVAVPGGLGEVALRLDNGDEVTIRGEASVARIQRTGIEERTVPLTRRVLGDLLAEELRHLDPDQAYSAALQEATGVSGLDDRPASRVLVWRDETAPAPTAETSIEVRDDPDQLADDVAVRLIQRLSQAQAARGTASIVLTGGRIANRIYERVVRSPARDSVDWSRVDVWWGDDRFLPSGDADRNETQARSVLLDLLPLDPRRIHPMPASDAPGIADPGSAAAVYEGELAATAGAGDLPPFDLLLLSVGEDGHVASVFPNHASAHESGPTAGVYHSPKPPPTRVTLTLPMLNRAREVWLLASGAEKAAVVGQALTDPPGPTELPAAGVHGRERTVWLLDRAAAAEVPPVMWAVR